jgi:hypothetical protein
MKQKVVARFSGTKHVIENVKFQGEKQIRDASGILFFDSAAARTCKAATSLVTTESTISAVNLIRTTPVQEVQNK